MVTDEFIEQVSEALDQLGYSVEQEKDVISDVSQINDDVTLPGIRVQSGTMTGYVSMKLAVLKQYLDNTVQTVQQTWDAWFSDVLPTGVRSIWNTWFGTSDQEGVRKTWGDWFTARSTEWGTLKIDAQAATTRANNAASAAEDATAGAENVNAGIQGFTVTITDRNGVSRSVDIGFDIYRTYPSVAAMNADAANVPQGKFVIIATTDKTSEENARMYCKNSQGSFSFLCDLDQASSSAWSDWLNNQKPLIEQATADANSAADLANAKANKADTAADNATSIYDTVRTWFNGDNNNGFKNTSESWLSTTQQTWNDWFSNSLATGVRKLWNDFWASINSSWNGFFGTSADDSNGVRKIWSTWYTATQNTWNSWFSDSLSDGVRKKWNDFWPACKNTWETWFGTSDASGVQKQWKELKDDCETSEATRKSNETGRVNAESSRVTAEQGRVNAESTRVTNETTRGTNEATRITNESARATAETTRETQASSDHTRAESDHTTATADHGTATTDHNTAVSDHNQALSDHNQALSDHNTAASDHGTAGADHTRAEGDHNTAGDDHTASVEATGYANDQGDYAKNMADHPSYLADDTQAHPGDTGYFYSWDYDTQQYVKGARLSLDFDSMTPEQKEALAEAVLEAIGFDQAPTQGSANAVTSNGIYTALQDVYSDIGDINDLIPSQTTTSNQLADKEFVNSSISKATATYRGSYNLVSDLHLTIAATQQQIAAALATAVSTKDNNDYAFVQIPTADDKPTEIARIDRYKYNGTAWSLEYSLNNSGYTSAQWAAINSGITSALTTKLTDLPTNAHLTELLAGKQDNITFASKAVCESIVSELT